MTIHSTNNFRTALKSSASFGWSKASGIGVGLLLALPLLASPALANPLSATVTTGAAAVVSSSNKTQIDQKSEDVVIDWSSFNIGAGQTTQFVQPNAQAIAVNRIGGNSASQILGTLDANGRIVLINGNGMLLGKGSQVNVGSLIATSTGGSDSDVLSGKFMQAGNQDASVVNQGNIRTSRGGLVALVAPNVSNAGTVNAKFGTVAVGAANKFTVDFTGDGLVSFAAQGDVNSKTTASNTGSLVGANVSLTAHAAEGVATGVVMMSGIVTAQTARNVGGTILLDAGDGSLSMTGTLNAAGQTGGGKIETSGNQVSIAGTVTAGRDGSWKVDPENLTIDASAASSIDGALNSGTSVIEQTTSGAASGFGNQSPGAGDIIVASPLAWNTSATLTLDSYHSIDVNSPITVEAGGALVFKTNDGGTGGDYFFSNGAGITYPGGSGLGASFTLNGTPYTLLYSVSDVQNINSNSAALQGDYALANPLDATSVTGWIPIGVSGDTVLNSGNGFSGVFAGLGNTISNLTINLPSSPYAGLIGYSSGTIRDIGTVGGSVTGGGGDLVATNTGTISDSYATGSVSGGGSDGGLVGNNGGTIVDSYASGAVTMGASGLYAGGLVGYNGGTITNSYATGAVTAGNYSNDVGGLVGENIRGEISNSYATGAVTLGTNTGSASKPRNIIAAGFDAYYIGGLVGNDVDGGSISGSYATGNVTSIGANSDVGGLVGSLAGTINDSYATGAVNGGGAYYVGGLVGISSTAGNSISNSYATGSVTIGVYAGGLVGGNEEAITNSYATGAVSGNEAGGLVALNEDGGTISGSYASGAINGGNTQAGGLVAVNRAGSTISNSYATGYVTGNATATGGLVGTNYGALTDVYATGAVIASSGGGLVGLSETGATVTDGYWDTQTTEKAKSAGGGTGLATSQLQNGLPAGFSGSVWGTAAGLYPYLLWQFSGTPEAIAGFAYKDGGATPLASTSAGAGYVYGLVDGNNIGSVSTGANGYFYFLVAPGTISGGGSAILTYTEQNSTTGEANGATLKSATGTLKGLKIWGNTLIAPTSDTSYSSASATSLQTQDASLISSATGSDTAAQTLVAGLADYGYLATGASFTIDEPVSLSNGFFAQTSASNANIAVNDTISLSGTGELYLNSTGNISASDTINTGGLVDLVAVGTVAESGAGAITSTALTGSSSGGATLTGANNIGTLDAFVNSGAGGFALTDGAALTVAAELNAGTGNLALTTTGSGNGLVLGGDLIAGGTTTLTSTGAITQNSGAITAAELTGSSVGNTKLAEANKIADLGAFTAGTSDFTFVDHQSLTIEGLLHANGVILTGTGTLNETTAGDPGGIEALRLSVTTVGGGTLQGSNDIKTLASFKNTGAGGISLIDGEKITLDGTVNAGTGNLALTTEGLGSNIAIDKAVTAGGVITLNSADGVAEAAAGVITSQTLTGETAGTVTLNGANLIQNLGEFTNTGGNFSLTNNETLTVAGTLSTGSHGQTLQVTTGDLDITGGLTGGTITLGSTNGEVMGAGTITANVLNVTANTGIDLTGPNHINTIGTNHTNSGPDVINNP
jgi:filamentous hemagglutinin family protein